MTGSGPARTVTSSPVTDDSEIVSRFLKIHNITGMSCPSWQWHRTGSRWPPVRTLPVAPLWCDLGFVPNSRGNKLEAAANLRPNLKDQLNMKFKTHWNFERASRELEFNLARQT